MPLNRQDKQKICLYKRAMRRQVYELMTTEAKNAFIRTIKADAAYHVLSDMDQYLRNRIKYGEVQEGVHVESELQVVRNQLWEFMRDNGINLEEEWS